MREVKKDLASLKFHKEVRFAQINRTIEIDFDPNHELDMEYDTHKGQPIINLEIVIGSSLLPRHSCACHKLNIVIRRSISRNQELTGILKSLNQSNAHIRKSIELSRTFSEKKCRLRLENLTRWSSAYLMLESVKRAYDRGIVFILLLTEAKIITNGHT